MSKTKEDDHTDVVGRLADGWEFSVRLADGTRERLCDHDNLDAVTARLEDLEKKYENHDGTPNPLWSRAKLRFSGARDFEDVQAVDDDGNPTGDPVQRPGKVEGRGWVRAADVRGIAYWSETAKDDAYEAVRALKELEHEVAEDAAEDAAEKLAAAGMFGDKEGPESPEGEDGGAETPDKPEGKIDPISRALRR